MEGEYFVVMVIGTRGIVNDSPISELRSWLVETYEVTRTAIL